MAMFTGGSPSLSHLPPEAAWDEAAARRATPGTSRKARGRGRGKEMCFRHD